MLDMRERTQSPAAVDAWRGLRFEWPRFLLALCVIFHAWMAAAIAIAPHYQLINAGTRPVFDVAPRWFWGGAYAVAAAGALFLTLRSRSPLAQMVTWLTVFPLFFVWEGAFVIAVAAGRGSAISVIVWPTIYLPWAVVAVRLALGRR